MKLYVHVHTYFVHTHCTTYVPFSRLGMAYLSIALAGAGHPGKPLSGAVFFQIGSVEVICKLYELSC